MKTQILGLLAATALLAGCAGSHKNMGGSPDNDHNVLTGGPVSGTTIGDLPPAVRDSLRRRSPNAEIADIDKLNRDGQMVYRFTFIDPKRNPKLYLTDDGSVWWESSVDMQ
jgi:hypothetical protein